MLGLYQYLHASILKVVSSHLMVQLELIIIPDCFTAYNLTSFKKKQQAAIELYKNNQYDILLSAMILSRFLYHRRSNLDV